MAIPPEETLNGLIERVTFHNQETGFCVLKVKAKGHKDLVVVIGACAVVGPVLRKLRFEATSI